MELYDMKMELEYLPLGIITQEIPFQKHKDSTPHASNTTKRKLFDDKKDSHTKAQLQTQTGAQITPQKEKHITLRIPSCRTSFSFLQIEWTPIIGQKHKDNLHQYIPKLKTVQSPYSLSLSPH